MVLHTLSTKCGYNYVKWKKDAMTGTIVDKVVEILFKINT